MKLRTAYRYLQKRRLVKEGKAIEKTSQHRYRVKNTITHTIPEKR
jgi:hypothetical protein